MRHLVLCSALALGVWGSTAVQARQVQRPDTYVICLDQRGAARPALCRNVQPGRLNDDQGFCLCQGPDRRVEAPVCARDEDQPTESKTFELARRDAARDGSLVGDTFEGRSMCVTARSDR